MIYVEIYLYIGLFFAFCISLLAKKKPFVFNDSNKAIKALGKNVVAFVILTLCIVFWPWFIYLEIRGKWK